MLKKISRSGIDDKQQFLTQETGILIHTIIVFQSTTIQSNYLYEVIAEQGGGRKNEPWTMFLLIR